MGERELSPQAPSEDPWGTLANTGFQPMAPADVFIFESGVAGGDRRSHKKRRRDGTGIGGNVGTPCEQDLLALPYSQPPPPPELELIFAMRTDMRALSPLTRSLPPSINRSTCRARVGRGGRIIFDRCLPVT